MNPLIARLPDRRSMLGVYATAVFFVYGWTLLASFWKVPSWMFFLKVSDILSVYAYSFVIDFAESLFLLGLMLLFGILLPNRCWNAQFAARGAIWVIILTGSAMLRLTLNRSPDRWESFVADQALWWGGTIFLALVFTVIISRFRYAARALESLTDRLVVFLYIYLPLTALAVLVVLGRVLV